MALDDGKLGPENPFDIENDGAGLIGMADDGGNVGPFIPEAGDGDGAGELDGGRAGVRTVMA
ncbi:hypothetical protein EXIGLDRAFT_779215 [Exidia glandulosa HHB12029]|uniref:Uncharacterized protein n=1 Tax=Exidia glandulosa HHB12029 TaxID=1314781 RepID=A0A165C5Y3_EXIGL|nr:hypothetical protein EXIGLDRAFT_779215 [Exidia glandulosa HHB12029]